MPSRALAAHLAAVGMVVGAGMAAAGPLTGYRLLVLDGHIVKWGAPVLGTGATVTYAVADTATTFADARNCRSLVPPDGLLAASRVDPTAFRAEVVAAFAAWSAVADISFTPATDPATADILIGAEGDPFGVAFTNVSHAPATADPAAITRSVICLNPAAGWKVGFDGNLQTYDLRYAIEHEIGHAIGLDHPGVPGVLMDFRYTEAFRVPQAADIAGAAALYGGRGTEGPLVASAVNLTTPAKPDPFLGTASR